MFGRYFTLLSRGALRKGGRKISMCAVPLIASGLGIYFREDIRMMTDNVLENAIKTISAEIEDMKKKYGNQVMTFPQVNYSLDVGVYKIDYLVDQRKCDIFTLLVIASNLIQEKESKEKNNPTPFVTITTFKQDNVMTYKIEFKETGKYDIKHKGSITITGEWRNDRPSFKFTLEKHSDLSATDLKIISETYLQANLSTAISSERLKNMTQFPQKNQQGKKNNNDKDSFSGEMKKSPQTGTNSGDKEVKEPMERLKEMGIVVFTPEDKNYLEGLTWDILAGYESQKRDIEDTVLLSLTHSEIFDDITSQTRVRFEKNRAKAVLFEGPPGTGKTTSAKIIASQVGIPLLYLPLESVMSKWYGESEKKLADIFDAASELGKSIIFIDEIDALALGRSEVVSSK